MKPTLVKICGVTRLEDARLVVEAGADWLGINFWPQSKRHVDIERGAQIAAAARAVRADIVVVGVFVNQSVDEITRAAELAGLDYVQLHGDESPELCAAIATPVIKALAMRADADIARIGAYPCDIYLIDTPTVGYGGSGRTFDWSLARAAVATQKSVVLAGGLTPENVADAVATVRPFGVDVASGVESAPGIKDAGLVASFVARAKGERND